jgi:type II secretory pathway pseudopilin PulG
MLFRKKKNNYLLGFTILELMIVLTIMIVLAILVISGYSEGRPRLAVERTTESFIMDLYRVRERGFSSTLYHNGVQLIEGMYGIKINKNEKSYIIFINNIDTIVEEIELEGLVKILEIKNVASVNETLITFSSNRDVYFDGELAEEGDIITVIFSSEKDENIKRIIEINYLGIAEIIY